MKQETIKLRLATFSRSSHRLDAFRLDADYNSSHLIGYRRKVDLQYFYSGTTLPILLQKSHLAPLPPSQLPASTILKSFSNPGPICCVPLTTCPINETARTLICVPPVSFRFAISGFSAVYSGHLAKTPSESDGLPLVMKLPQISNCC